MPKAVDQLLTALELDRRRRRWRLVALVALAVAALLWWGRGDVSDITVMRAQPHIAKVSVTGMVLDEEHQSRILADLADNEGVKALVVTVDSPGGTMAGGLSLYHGLRHVARKKPVVVVMKTVAASAGYLVSLGADYIFTNEATLTGSIGVFLPLVDATGLAGKVGIKSEDVVSGDLKAVTSPLWPRDAQDRVYLQSMVNTVNDIFYKYVQERRPDLTDDVLANVRDGRVVIGAQAVEWGLVDAIGGLAEAKTWLQEQAGLAEGMSVVDYSLRRPQPWIQRALEVAVPGWTLVVGRLTGLVEQPAVWSVMR
jgi:protease-4